MFLAEARTWEITSVYEGYDVDDYLVFVEDGVYYYGNDRGEIGFATNLYQDYYETARLEDSAVLILVKVHLES